MGTAHGYAHVFYNGVTALVGREQHLMPSTWTVPSTCHCSPRQLCLWSGQTWIWCGGHLDEEVAGWPHSELRTAAHCPSAGQGQAAFLRDQGWGWITPLMKHWTVHPQGKVSEREAGRGWNKVIFKVPSYPTVL